jgi:adenylosuccinate lyase
MRVDTARMRENLELTRGIIFSGQLLLDLAAAGMLREDAYRLVQGHAMHCWEHGEDFRAAVEADPEIGRYLTADKLEAVFNVNRQLSNIEAIFSRVFAGEDA